MQPNKKVYIAFAVVIAAMAFLIFWGFNDDTMLYYSTVSELKARGTNAYGQGFRVSGRVVKGSVKHDLQNVRVEFDIEEQGETLHVVYDGILPDTFKEDMDVLLEGTYQPGNTFHATNVFTKCASKYEPAEGESNYTNSDATGTN